MSRLAFPYGGVGILLCMVMAWPGQATAQALGFKSAITQVIDEGRASLWLAQEFAQQINEGFGRPATERVRVGLERVQQFNPQCARVRFVFNDTTNTPLFDMAMNLCKDGSPPLEGVDWSTPIPDGEATTVPRFMPQ